ncbi:hypothetical protein BS78_01G368700 [Paspalum vaginatum]|nr:hypothetical protein BS78_01G368700 [Paspalum vaginatum]
MDKNSDVEKLSNTWLMGRLKIYYLSFCSETCPQLTPCIILDQQQCAQSSPRSHPKRITGNLAKPAGLEKRVSSFQDTAVYCCTLSLSTRIVALFSSCRLCKKFLQPDAGHLRTSQISWHGN